MSKKCITFATELIKTNKNMTKLEWIIASICYMFLWGLTFSYYFTDKMDKAIFWAIVSIAATVVYNILFPNNKQ